MMPLAATPQNMTPMTVHRAGHMLEKANWAASVYGGFSRDDVLRIAEAAADACAAKAEYFAEAAVAETGYGVVEHKTLKNKLCSRGIFDHYRDHDYCGYRADAATKIVEVARPAGVIFALTPSTNPVCTVAFKIILALITRNAIVISPHPAARRCCSEAAMVMNDAAMAVGLPDGVIQVIEEPSLEIIDALMRSAKTDVILATGGAPMVRAAYGSGNPALGVGPGNCPAYVAADADVARAAKVIVQSKAFDNSVLCTNESAIIADAAIIESLRRELRKQGCHICSEAERQLVEDALFPLDKFNIGMIGQPAKSIAKECGFRVPPKTRVLVVPLERIGDDYPLSREKMCPVLGLYAAANAGSALSACRAMVRRSGGGHSAAIHSRDPETILRFGAAVNVLRVVVNGPCSTGAAGFDTHLAPTMTIGTGFMGRSSVAGNLEPSHLIQWTKIAFDKDDSVEFPSFEGLSAGEARPLGETGIVSSAAAPRLAEAPPPDDLRAEIRRIVADELRQWKR